MILCAQCRCVVSMSRYLRNLPQSNPWRQVISSTGSSATGHSVLHAEAVTHTCEQAADAPTFFCFAVVTPGTHDVDIIRIIMKEDQELACGASLRGCHAFAIFSNMSYADLMKQEDISNYDPPAEDSNVIDGNMSVDTGGWYDTALNTPIFIEIWRAIFQSGIYKSFDWTVKVDMDAILFPANLRDMVEPFVNDTGALFLGNKKPGADHWGMMTDGPLEVMSREAIALYAATPRRCETEVSWEKDGFGEDLYLEKCLLLLGARGEFVRRGGLYNHAMDCKNMESPFTGAAAHYIKDASVYESCQKRFMPQK